MASQASSPPAEAIQRYRDLARQSQQLASKISELELERNEYKLVEDTLRPLDPARKAFRLVGGVLVERNVGEVLPSVQLSRENLEKTIATLHEKLEESQKEATDIKIKHNLQIEPSR